MGFASVTAPITDASVVARSAAMPVASLDEIPSLPDQRPSAEEQLVEWQARALLDDALNRLPLDLRVVLVLHEIEGLEVRQIASGSVGRKAETTSRHVSSRLSSRPSFWSRSNSSSVFATPSASEVGGAGPRSF